MKEKHAITLISWLVLILAAGAILFFMTGCQSGTTGTFRPIDPQVEHSITNAVSIGISAAKANLPVPWSTMFEAAGGASLTLLAAWQAMTHRQVKTNTAAIAAANDKPKT